MRNKTSKLNKSRRDFIKKSALASTFIILPRHVLGGIGFNSPSDQLAIAAIGSGGKGRSDILNASRNGKERVIALCDIDPNGNHGVIESRKNFPDAKFYEDFREMLDRHPEIDAVTISTPDHTHAVAAINAMQRNKHVYVQKPLTHNIREARILTEMARERKVVTQMGNQGSSNPDQLTVKNWINNAEIGVVEKVYVWTNRPVWPQGIPMPKSDNTKLPDNLNWDLWLGPAKKRDYIPNIHPFNWRGWWEYGTGALGDMGCHIIDVPFRALGLKYPKDVECSVGTLYSKMWTPDYIPEGAPPSSSTTLHFDATSKNKKPITMIWTDGGIRPTHPDLIPPNEDIGGNGGYNGVMMIGDKGIITTDVYGYSPKLYKEGQETKITTNKNNLNLSFKHTASWVQACKAGFNSPEHLSLTSSFDYAGPLTETVLMGNIGIRSYLLRRKNDNGGMDYYARKKLLWDGYNMKIINMPDANQFVTREYRKGWEI
tara:strand:+ start:766 stop:2223 length:1458 start_codon:yes stop_codon:yes gene_type:complete